jgi:selenocysteine-specific elongation factor
VRGIQVHGDSVTRAGAGQRTALNLAGMDAAELTRGMMLAEAGRFTATSRFDCVFELLPGAKPLKHRAPIHFHAHAAEVEGEIRGISTTEPIKPGSRCYVRVVLREPLLLLPGDRFIVRMFSPVVTIGGGVVLDISPPRRGTVERLRVLDSSSTRDRVVLLAAESRYGVGMRDLVARTGLVESEIANAVHEAGLIVLTEPQFWALNPKWVEVKLESMQQALKAFHRQKPLATGMPKEELRSRELPESPAFLLDALLPRAKTIVAEGDIVRLASHKVALREDEQDATAKIESAFQRAGLAVPATGEVLAKSGVEAARAKTLLQILLRDKKLVRVSEDLVFHANAVQQLRELLSKHKGTRFAVPEFKEWTGISRKYAIPLLEFLDREHVTRRDGDTRIVL